MSTQTTVYTGGAQVQQLLDLNKAWSQSTNNTYPALFPKLATGQSPQILWIGCSDSRVPETSLLGLNPGEVFVHRNIANVVNQDDISLPAVLAYAVDELKVMHIILCGHLGCGGVKAACQTNRLGNPEIDSWLEPLRDIRQNHNNLLSSMDSNTEQQTVVKLNVEAGLSKLAANPTVISAQSSRGMLLHAAVYDVATGLLNFLTGSNAAEPPSEALFDLEYYYNLTNAFGGPGNFLDIQSGIVTGNGQGGRYANQHWKFDPTGDGSFTIRPSAPGGLEDHAITMYADGRPMNVSPMVPSISAGQRWRVAKATDGKSFFITNDLVGSGKKLDVFSDSLAPQMSAGNFTGQSWQLTKLMAI